MRAGTKLWLLLCLDERSAGSDTKEYDDWKSGHVVPRSRQAGRA
jgi:hypothetical protein